MLVDSGAIAAITTHNLATNGGKMSGWQIAGNVGMIGLNFAPALGAAGGAALKG